MKLVYATALLLCLSSANAEVVRFIRNPQGWPIPSHTVATPCEANLRDDRDTKCFKLEGVVVLPWYYMDGETLVMQTVRSRGRVLRELSVGGKVYGFSAIVVGVDAGPMRPACWIDEHGSGKFTLYGTFGCPKDLPDWVMSRK